MSGVMDGVFEVAAIAILLPAWLVSKTVSLTVGGTYHLAKAIGRGIAEQNRKERAALENCSQQLQEMYAAIQKFTDSQQELECECRKNLESELVKAADALERMFSDDELQTEQDLQDYMKKLSDFSKESEQNIEKQLNETIEGIKTQTAIELSNISNVYQYALQGIDIAAKYQAGMEQESEIAKTLAQTYLKDAIASIRLLQSQSVVSAQLDIMNSAYREAEISLNAGNFQACIAQTQKIISKCAEIYLDTEIEQVELNAKKTYLMGKLENVINMMEERRYVKFPYKGSQDDAQEVELEEDLNDFSQNQYEETQKCLTKKMSEINAEVYTIQQLQLMEVEIDQLVDQARRIMDGSQNLMASYYTKIDTLETVMQVLEEKGYDHCEVCSEGDDLSQALVGVFQDAFGNTISVSLNNEKDSMINAASLGSTGLHIDIYEAEDEILPQSEREKMSAEIEQEIINRGAIVRRNISCVKGTENKSSEDQSHRTIQNVSKVKSTPIKF